MPEGVDAVVDISGATRASVRTAVGVVEIDVECISREQTAIVCATMKTDDRSDGDVPDHALFADLPQRRGDEALPAAVGRDGRGSLLLDIVEDGPHAIVAGTTGAGKSELLVTWVCAIASRHGPDEVVFVLADFKGGTAFDGLRDLPQVAAVITDLDGEGAVRGVTSLTAELRRRESVLAAAGARDIRGVSMPRLVIVVDEFAALLQEHQDLAGVFVDIAARGRALGMHLILGTQRAAGVIRDALAANCPLRISLRVGDASDSRTVIGTEDAAGLPGGSESRGLAFVRRPGDDAPVATRIGLTTAEDVANISEAWGSATRAVSPWLPPLPPMVTLEMVAGDAPSGSIIVGLADDPARQSQPLEVLRPGAERGIALIGQGGSGRTTALRALAHQHPGAVWIPSEPEAGWDALVGLVDHPTRRPSLILCDDIDAQLAAMPAEYAAATLQLWERLLRGDRAPTVVMSATRWAGAAVRVLELLPRRAVLQLPSRVEHIAADGGVSAYSRELPPGRARVSGREVQLVWVPEQKLRSSSARRSIRPSHDWTPTHSSTAVVTAGAAALVDTLQQAYPSCLVTRIGDVRNHSESSLQWIVVDEPEAWQRERLLWQRMREGGEVLVRAENATEMRHLVGIRDLPPYARTHAGRLWSVVGAERPRRVAISALCSEAAG
ncbi:FtsK/SpoIIIE domain-containing protein [Microbacterium sp. 1.5R]|uniref:FtsK/SpoIIIE domain-containing protein n=1 Tax=Microbacterium sp. 1.5R TaxID=1916917 RepID=UPI00119EA00D|nr:FtsK/SpoIIIE domain-containing protein [Microbacterium sp. 1.5R]